MKKLIPCRQLAGMEQLSKKMDELIDYTLKIIFRLVISEYFQYATGSCIIVSVLALIYRLTGKGRLK